MLKAYIVDDEPLARDELAYILRRSRKVEVVGEAGTLEQALQEIPKLVPDVVFLDIQLNEDSGIQLAQQLAHVEPRPDIVFATAYDEYALKAFELNAVDYILKPFDEYRIGQTVEKMAKLKQAQEGAAAAADSHRIAGADRDRIDKLAVTVDDRILLIHVDKIISIGSVEGKSVVVTDTGSYKVSEPLVAFEQKLHHTPIIRVHRAFLVNLDAIVEIQPWFNSTYNLIMKDGSSVPVSRSHIKDLKGYIGF